MTTSFPTWLDPNTEIKNSDQPDDYKKLDDITKSVVFILSSYEALKQSDSALTLEQTLWVIGNSIAETGWGKAWKGLNMGGWKINKDFSDSYKKRTGKSALWWQAPGHIASGDDPICYYRGFAKLSDFYSEWLLKFVPKDAPNSRYSATGKAFLAGSRSWFLELCKAGYKGPVTQANPDPSVHAWMQIIDLAMIRTGQFLLGVKIDGNWGKGSKTACSAFQTANGLKADGVLDLATLEMLINKWKATGASLPVKL